MNAVIELKRDQVELLENHNELHGVTNHLLGRVGDVEVTLEGHRREFGDHSRKIGDLEDDVGILKTLRTDLKLLLKITVSNIGQ